ncbi:family 43 glycosylhydrolase [Sanguibacter hominis ATCC BAA-789]|uniref:Family 43 glycosylhydrolase n=1 Tax=Sanguibacter hominis ATCC BAA-789 TaxID=1312740 RepID=A0A9X5IQW6_9MICO|nr:immunoglobulin-like domain-containing protein [Sanguibacter hominis]NKX92374.1 family 43 glycosylhydrolase [Sanguibacter hominis ATCC BAA-789]
MRERRTAHRRWLALGTAWTTAAAVALTGLATVPAQAAGDEPDLLAWYKLDETSGGVAADASGNGRDGTVAGAATWNGGDGFTFSGGGNNSGNAITLPDNLLAGVDDVTIDFDVWVDASLSGNYFIFNFGNPATYPNGTGYLFVTGKDSSSRLRATIASDGYHTEQSVSRPGGIATGVWKHLTYVVDGGSVAEPGAARLYEDGQLVASTSGLTVSPKDLGEPDGTTTRNVLGRSAYPDNSFKGKIRDFKVYDGLLDADAVRAADAQAIDLGDLTDVGSDLTLPTRGAGGSQITWSSSDPDVVSTSGHVVPTADTVEVTLTATVSLGGAAVTRDFVVNVQSLQQVVDDVLDGLDIPHLSDVRGNVLLPARVGVVDLVWTSDKPAVITPTGEVTRPAAGGDPVEVTLTVSAAAGVATGTRQLTARVAPAPVAEEPAAYFFPYFTGEQAGGEKIFFGASKGNDALHWDELNDGRAVLTSEYGEKGLRDPFIIRSPEGDRFYLLATDLQIAAGGNFGTAQETGSLYLEIWESTDLVSWSDQRHVKVSSDYAGNTWAPEAHWDESTGSYLVYWASNLYETTSTTGRSASTSYNRMMVVSTRDFVTFTEPQTWIDVKRGSGKGTIDSTVVEHDDVYYRFTKDEASMTVRQEKSTDLHARIEGSLPTTSSSPGWQLIKEAVGVGQPNGWGGAFTNGEGPTIFKANDGDVNTGGQDTWYLFQDQPSYHGGRGYVPFASTDLESGTWTSVAEQADLPLSPRHGTVLPITQTEYENLLAAYQPDLLVDSIAAQTVTTREGVAPTLPATAIVTYRDGSTRAVPVTWPTIDPAQYAERGTFILRAAPVAGSPVEASVTVVVRDAVDPTVALTIAPATPTGSAGWWTSRPVTVTATGSDDSGVASVEVSVDGGAWQRTAGGTASVTLTTDGRHEVRARATDTTDNVSSVAVVGVDVDTTAPVTSATVDAKNRTVTVRADDATSGVARIETRTGSAAWATYSGPVVVGSGEVTVEFRGVDRAGNVEPVGSVVVPRAGVVLAPSATVAVVAPERVSFGKAASVRVRVSGAGGVPSGQVRVLDGARVVGSATLKQGGATVRLVKDVAVGRRSLTVSYGGDARFAGSSDVVVLEVVKASSKVSVKVAPKKVTARSKATLAVSVTSVGSRAGTVGVKVTSKVKGKNRTVVTRSVSVGANGKASVKLPRLGKGTYKVTVTFGGSSSANKAAKTTTLTVRR